MISNVIPVPKQNVHVGNGVNKYFPPVLPEMRREFNQLFDRFFGNFPSYVNPYFPPHVNYAKEEQLWGVELIDKNDYVQVRFEAPGFDVKEMDLKWIGNELVLRAEHKWTVKEKEENEMSLYRSITLPPGLVIEKADAKFTNGLLTVFIPKSEVGIGRKIAIQPV
jgi:HSP20 family protein